MSWFQIPQLSSCKLLDLEVTTPRGCIIPRGVPNRLLLDQDQNYILKSADSLCTHSHESGGEHHSVHGTHDRVLTQFWLAEHMATPRPPPSLPPSPSPLSLRLSRHPHTSFLAKFSPHFFSCNVYCKYVIAYLSNYHITVQQEF